MRPHEFALRAAAAVLVPVLLGLPAAASAQGMIDESGRVTRGAVAQEEWAEADAPPPPAFDASRVLPFEATAMSSLKFGIDPRTLTIGKDGVLRYVMVATSSTGAMNAMYEGLRCSTGEYKTYARYNPSGGWSVVKEPAWEPLKSTRSSAAYYFSRQGGCPDNGTAVRVDEVLRELKSRTYIRYDHN